MLPDNDALKVLLAACAPGPWEWYGASDDADDDCQHRLWCATFQEVAVADYREGEPVIVVSQPHRELIALFALCGIGCVTALLLEFPALVRWLR